MIQISALPAFTDNYIWLLQDHRTQCCVVVDPGDAAPVLAWLDAHPGWTLSDILITHHHHDHVGGVERLKQASGATVYGPASENIPARDVALKDNDSVSVLGWDFDVYAVPGHTLGHIAYYHHGLLFCGDTLFAAGCGRLFEGTPEQMHHSLSRLAALPEDTLVYCTHEYTLSNLKFAAAVEPSNADIAARLEKVTQQRQNGVMTLPSTLALEKLTNPFLRTAETLVTQKVDEREGAQNRAPSEVFAALRAWKDTF
ncbi:MULTISPECIES: hydroxyacylglutathione hydrolase [Pseudomonas]|uniref:Hydroxyacylglutathione hydrolase n=1 Tax=Pseudomonas fluorescens TaxID=294 RepID=A0A5E7FHC8_PSEFL|nr:MULTISPECIES: hydroxyacylglutathione hydrolase [Pseudomonas]MBP5947720.1 hydroxyacylglutathione hydrolase [Pseudomonas sp. P9(2020)]MBP5959156.1 hydroxyacylglutathione hydrolase [Pseudomonas anatoliensis]MBZ9565809.1 hydroxyacylglutathione hydrolase [Pseudomonas sp. P116]VVO38730.1 Hydroxyacylglutathione hydrolase [Pseudomonas fluorescens]VVP40020.1 Hydroxyacylglutathione hydrolase [Pseudomonas fluorescens]